MQAYDGSEIRKLELQDWPAVDTMLNRAFHLHTDRGNWLPAYERREILKRLYKLMLPEAENFAVLIAREGGKPLTDARAEVSRAINGIDLAIEEMGRLGGREIPMDLTAAGAGRTAFTYREPIGVVVAISAFNHPNIIRVTDLGEHGKMHYIAMEFIDGEDLLATGIRRDLTYWQVTEIIAKLASVLKLVHGKNIWHRDIKPQNILLDRSGEVKLIDFGIATIEREQEDAAKTGEGLIMGTPAFLSPEQAARGKMGAIDGRADIYSLGAVFYYMLTGRRPFTGRSALEILAKNMKDPPPHPHDIDHLIPSGLVQICLKMLEKDPDDRYQSADALLNDIAKWRKHKQGRAAGERHKKIVALKAKKASREKSGS